MLKKSLKFGSMLLLIFAMATFAFIGCSNGTTDDPLDEPVVPVDPTDPTDPVKPVDPTDPVDPVDPPIVITGITIDPASLEMLAGERYLFKAVVSGSAADKTVKWSVAIADEDFYNIKEDGTTIIDNKGAGMLTIDAGQYWGTTLTVTATSNADPSVYGEATVKVVKPGPRLAWTPPTRSVTTDVDGEIVDDDDVTTSTGRLLDIAGKNITIFDGEYIEGEHYYIRRVDNLNQTLEGGVVTVTGSADEGTITVVLEGPIQGLRGHIGVTLYPAALEGDDASIIDLDTSELVYTVTANNLITGLGDRLDIDTPLRGDVTVSTLTATPNADTNYTPSYTGAITWTGTPGGQYTHRSSAVASFVLQPASGYSFYTFGINESTIKAKFRNGSPEISNVSVSSSRISFTATYTIKAMVIGKTNVAYESVNAELGNKIKDLFLAGMVTHTREVQPGLWINGESPYYNLDRPLEWTGVSGKTFVGGRTAVATVTIPAKAGYTFEGTDIDPAYLRAIFLQPTANPPAVEILSAGDSLVFTLSYYVPKTDITQAMLKANVSEKLPIPNTTISAKTKLGLSKNPPFVAAAVTWTGLAAQNKFVKSPTANVIATIKLTAKEGYQFDTASLNTGMGLSADDVAVNGTAKVEYNLSTSLEITVTYNNATILQVLDTGVLTGLTPVLPSNLIHDTASTASISGGTNLGTSTIVWTEGVDTGKLDYTETGKLKGTVTLVPGTGYTFDSFSSSTAFQNSLRALFPIGGTQPAISPAPKASTPIAGVSNLVFTVEYTLSPKPASDTINQTLIGTLGAGVAATLKDTGNASGFTTPVAHWTKGAVVDLDVTPISASWDSSADVTDLDVGDILTIKLEVEPNAGYILTPLTDPEKTTLTDTIETAVDLAIYTANASAQTASSDVSIGANTGALLEVTIVITIDS
jgi:hypothetical protein